ncbi:MAG: anhydro-N-acetylmuramic acid kinase [Elusimicrobiaceae bacterium]|nr:anhydro-N-acetylmuramic acid kinase [Elusimicrobiaceae bacterium]
MTKFALGLMSGTSADGLTVCAVRPMPFKVICFKNYPYTRVLQQKLLKAYQLNADSLSALHYELGALYAQTVQRFLKDFHLSAKNCCVIGSHGQTILHAPHAKFPHTLQLAEPSFLAEKIGAPVVSDFRARDIALGGEGAPLMPFFDTFIWGKGSPKILLNIGGISNISLVGKGVKPLGFDVGPGNTLIDLCTQKLLHKPFDKNGVTAAKGTPDKALVKALLAQPFFKQKPPKSLDKNAFGEDYLTRFFGPLNKKHTPDLLATLTYFTAAAIANQIIRFVPRRAQKEIIVSGGGSYNTTLLSFLQENLPHTKLSFSTEYGIDPQAKEAAAFALFAWLALNRKVNHRPQATGAQKATVLGKITL